MNNWNGIGFIRLAHINVLNVVTYHDLLWGFGIRTSTVTETPPPLHDSLNVQILSVQYGYRDPPLVRLPRPPLYGYRDPSVFVI